jgi:predicted nicotinamide N-methyase
MIGAGVRCRYREAVDLAPVPLLPELRLYQADSQAGLFDGGYRSDQPPPFWAFAWPGGIALARHLLDNPATVAGLRVLDLAAGSGLVAVAAGLVHASRVRATDVDAMAVQAIRLNAQANGVTVDAERVDVLDDPAPDADAVLVGDGFYTRSMADRMMRYLRRCADAGRLVLVGDPGREFLSRKHFTAVAEYAVPVRPALEDVRTLPTTIWRLNRHSPE